MPHVIKFISIMYAYNHTYILYFLHYLCLWMKTVDPQDHISPVIIVYGIDYENKM